MKDKKIAKTLDEFNNSVKLKPDELDKVSGGGGRCYRQTTGVQFAMSYCMFDLNLKSLPKNIISVLTLTVSLRAIHLRG